jgi:hypothetical protein
LTHVTDLELVDLSSLAAGPAPIPKTTPGGGGRTFDRALVSDRSAYAVSDLPVFTIAA